MLGSQNIYFKKCLITSICKHGKKFFISIFIYIFYIAIKKNQNNTRTLFSIIGCYLIGLLHTNVFLVEIILTISK